MIIAAAVCPGAPWLLPGVAPQLAARASTIGTACQVAVRGLRSADRIVALVPARRWSVDAAAGRPARGVSAAGPGPDPTAHRLTVTRSDRGRGPVQDVGSAVAAHLLTAAGIAGPVTVVEVDDAARSSDDQPVRPLFLDDPDVRTGVLVLADGAAAHGPAAPGREDPRSAGWDRALAAALAGGDPAALAAAAAVDADPAPTDLLARVAGLRVLAAWTRGRPPARAAVLAQSAPFGVGYVVARWEWDDAADRPDERAGTSR